MANTHNTSNSQQAVTGECSQWHYSKPRTSGKMLLLTVGGMCVTGTWQGELGQYYLAWAPMLKRDKQLEAEIFKTRKR